METTLATWILVHAVVGVTTLVAGLATLAAPKRAGFHPMLGRATLVGLVAAIGLALPVMVARSNAFLVGIGLIVLGHAWVAWRFAALRPTQALAGRDRAAVLSLGVAYAAFAARGVAWGLDGLPMGWVCVGLSAIGATLVRSVLRYDGSSGWRGLHVQGAAGAFIASVTAFSAATGPSLWPTLPEWLLWVLPTVVLTPVFLLAGRDRGAAVRS
ncbi:MAG: hypothetical protein H6733_09085 [Alphaproteobacteria bacterium]|nr:hypothetical protein [Alphaproteobacteria bacterium]